MKKIPFIVIACLFLFVQYKAFSQEKPSQWTLSSCLDYALKNNIQIKQSKLSHLSSLEDTKEAKAQLLPSVGASVSQGYTNTPSTENTTTNSYTGSYAINANWKIYSGNSRRIAISQQTIQNQMDQLSIEKSENDIRIAIVSAYLQMMYASESVKINENTVATSAAQLKRSKELLQAGSISQVDYTQLESQYSTDCYQLTVAQTTLANNKLQLKQLLELDINDEIALNTPDLNDKIILIPLEEKKTIYNRALSVLPEIKSSQLNVDISDLSIQSARSGYLPSLALSTGIGTGHLSGSNYTLGNQIWNKFNESVGLTISIPIASNRSNKTNVNKARINASASRLDYLSVQKELLKIIENTYQDATSSQMQYQSALEKLKYVEQSYNLVNEQFLLGMKNPIDLLTEKNSLLTTKQELLQSKYLAAMSILLLDIYQNKTINANY